ncbi:hypothetical protein J3458_003503 [Metarhizium acridum]|uniref:uncharacterized protein n=1 Tax=Metarhizium acridum TaxID=92637 RepID=UPI001C6C8AA6|nr:hypothetical protein J3458_003503 [Metarhizium acridum]
MASASESKEKKTSQKINNPRFIIVLMVLITPSLEIKYNERAGSVCILPLKQKYWLWLPWHQIKIFPSEISRNSNLAMAESFPPHKLPQSLFNHLPPFQRAPNLMPGPVHYIPHLQIIRHRRQISLLRFPVLTPLHFDP